VRGKLKRFEENYKSHIVFEPNKEGYESLKGTWKSEVFQSNRDLIVELGCGKGEYTIGLSRLFPNQNFVGIDIKGDRIWVGRKMAEEEGLTNVRFLRTEIAFLLKFFEKGEVDEMWLTFPDPRPKKREMKRRLTHPNFLAYYQHILKEDGWFKFKTDNTQLFEYTLEVLTEEWPVNNLEYTFDLYSSQLNKEHYGIKTKYEQLFHAKGESIKYLKFQFDHEKTGKSMADIPSFISGM